MIQYNLNSLQQNVRECSWRLCSLACCRIRRVARTQWVMPVFQAAVHGASPATKVATAAAIFTLDRYRRRPSVDLAVRCFYCLTYVLLAHKCQLSSKDQAHHTDNTTTLQATRPHYISKCSEVSHHKNAVSCGCGVGVVCLVFGGRCLARPSVHELLQMQRHPSQPEDGEHIR